MLPKLGFSLQKQYALPVQDVVALLRQAGFSCLSPIWAPDAQLPAIDAAARQQGMTLQSLHAPSRDVTKLWQKCGPETDHIKDAVLQTIDACNRYHVPIMVLHGWRGFDYTFRENDLFFDHFDDIVAHAQAQGIRIAFENLEGEEYLAALMARYRDVPHVGYCWDSGHDHCYPHKTDFLSAYGDRLIMTHLNDNLGTRDPAGKPAADDDLHFLPFDGKLDWDRAMARLRCAKKVDTLNFELKVVSHSKAPQDRIYVDMPLPQYIEEAGKRARMIANLYSASSESHHIN